MPQIVNRGDVEIQVGPHHLIKDQPVDIGQLLANELLRTPEVLQERGLELILEPKGTTKTN